MAKRPGRATAPAVAIVAGDEPRYDAIPEIAGDALLLFDPHVPCHDHAVIERAVAHALALGVEVVLIGGDLFHFPQYRRRGPRQQRARSQEDMALAGRLLLDLRRYFPQVHVILGNHDWWGVEAQEGHFDPDYWIASLTGVRGVAGVTVHASQHCWVVSGGRRHLVTHGTSGRVSDPLKLPEELAELWDAPIICGHLHRARQGWSRNGQHQITSVGCVADPRRFAYQHLTLTRHPAQQQAYALLRAGWHELVTIRERD